MPLEKPCNPLLLLFISHIPLSHPSFLNWLKTNRTSFCVRPHLAFQAAYWTELTHKKHKKHKHKIRWSYVNWGRNCRAQSVQSFVYFRCFLTQTDTQTLSSRSDPFTSTPSTGQLLLVTPSWQLTVCLRLAQHCGLHDTHTVAHFT